jgi:REP element-mobilizing transposase RayT
MNGNVGVGFIRPVRKHMKKLPVRKNIRLRHYDYKQDGYYFVTICCSEFRPNLERYKEVAEKILHHLPEKFSGLKIDYFTLMPTHLHVIFVFDRCRATLGEVVRTYKALVTKRVRVNNFWQRNYYEHVIRSENALSKIREYIQNNPDALNIRFEEFYKDNQNTC